MHSARPSRFTRFYHTCSRRSGGPVKVDAAAYGNQFLHGLQQTSRIVVLCIQHSVSPGLLRCHIAYPSRRACIVEMKSRVEYLRQQAEEFRRAGELSHNEVLRAQLQKLADQCDAIAANIAENLPIHERLREPQSTRNSS
jgi:hypothetical protein